MRYSGPGRVVFPLLLAVLLLTPAAAFHGVWRTDSAHPAGGDPVPPIATASAGPATSTPIDLMAAASMASAAAAPEAFRARPAAGVRLFGTVGLGFLDTKRDVGADIPVGVALLLERWRLLGTASILDFALVEGDDRDRRYYRPRLGYSYCVDSLTGRLVPEHYCSGGTNVTRSSTLDLSYIVFNEVWFSDKPGKVSVGVGYRMRRPASAYATLGVLFPSRSRRAMGGRLDIGSDFVHMGVVWGWDLVRMARR